MGAYARFRIRSCLGLRKNKMDKTYKGDIMTKPLDLSKFRKNITKSIKGISSGFNDPDTWISTGSYALNYLISGDFYKGVPMGKVTILAGQSGSGKSFLASGNIVRDAQEQGIFVVLIDSVSKRYSECGLRIGALITKNDELRRNIMKFCQARLSPPLIGQIAAEASIDADPKYMLHNYNEYVNRRKFLIDGLNRIEGVYSPIPMGAFYTVAKLPVDDADRFCAWLLSDFEYENQTLFMAPASGFYTDPKNGINQVRIAYVLKKEDLAVCLKILEEALKVYPGSKVRQKISSETIV
ncbi:MAG: aminotransferase class I/II-fold pyridoxal phosphate-dependent enzyme [Sphingobacteriia bacterium]|nr:aminotransferase class I/II-fold pyridoxal phosphate-dependent enzyme [Sphingobacteriia bacterium]